MQPEYMFPILGFKSQRRRVVMNETIETIISNMAEEIQAIDDDLMMDVVGVSQALGQLRIALDKIDKCLDQRQFSEASNLGYSDVSSEFIFLQRVLGALQGTQGEKEALVSKIALKAKISYEEAFPFLDQQMDSSKPKAAKSTKK